MKNEPNQAIKKHKRTLTGVVLRRSGDKTVAVEVSRVEVHALYHKRRTVSKTYLAHDTKNVVKAGDKVVIRECRPLSARKRWEVVLPEVK